MKFHPGFLAGHGESSIYKHIVNVGLDGNLANCLDFGVGTCYPGTGQTVHDLCGNADYWMGLNSSVEAIEPVFHGTAGRATASEYMDMGVITAKADLAWHTSAHKDGATFTVMMIGDMLSSAQVFVTTSGGPGVLAGFWVTCSSGSNLQLRVANGTSLCLGATSTIAGSPLATNVMFVSVSENGGATASHFRINGNAETFNGSYTSPTSAAQGYATAIGLGGTNYKLAGFAAWSRALSVSETLSIYNEVRTRWGI